MRWHINPRDCSHSEDDACLFCDPDRYYADKEVTP